jgi:branched-chain amino acid transport system permease protein
MNDFFAAYKPLFDITLLSCGLAFSQYVVLRAGVESFATAAFAAIGAYFAAILVTRVGMPASVAIVAAGMLGAVAGGLLSIPLARLRSVFQAIATIAFVQIIVSLILYAEPITGGALGINGIPQLVGTFGLVAYVVVVVVLMSVINRSGIGRAFDALRQDETVAVALGISVIKYHALAFILSGAIAGAGGGMLALNTYSIHAEQFGFPLLVAALAAVVLGGRTSVLGPIVGAGVLAVLPEIARPLAEQRLLVYGLILIVIIIYLPRGIVDTLAAHWKSWRALRRAPTVALGSADDQPVH